MSGYEIRTEYETTKVRKRDLVYPELSYAILGCLFKTWTERGAGHKEKIYQKAVATELRAKELAFTEQFPIKLYQRETFIGIYYVDFLIENKVVVELKVRNYFSNKDIQQLYSYLKGLNLQLGILAHFTESGVKYKRVVNIV